MSKETYNTAKEPSRARAGSWTLGALEPKKTANTKQKKKKQKRRRKARENEKGKGTLHKQKRQKK